MKSCQFRSFCAITLILVISVIVPISHAGASPSKTIFCFNATGKETVKSGVNPVCPPGYFKSQLTPPSSPRGVFATARATSIAVSWGRPLNLGGSSWVGYIAKTYGNWGAKDGYCMVQTLTTCTIFGLTPGHIYQIDVQAYNGLGLAGMSIPVKAASVKTLGSPPTTTTTTTLSPAQLQDKALRNWYASFSLIMNSFNRLISDYNLTINNYGIGNAWSMRFVSGFSSIASQIDASPAPNGPRIVQAQSALTFAMRKWICYGETFNGYSCPGVFGGWLGNGSQWTNTVSQAIGNLTAAIQSYGIY